MIEDNCESLGSIYKNKLLGSYGFASSHSFIMATICQLSKAVWFHNNNALKNIMLSVRSHGWGRDLDEKKKSFEKKFDANDFQNYIPFIIQVLI